MFKTRYTLALLTRYAGRPPRKRLALASGNPFPSWIIVAFHLKAHTRCISITRCVAIFAKGGLGALSYPMNEISASIVLGFTGMFEPPPPTPFSPRLLVAPRRSLPLSPSLSMQFITDMNIDAVSIPQLPPSLPNTRRKIDAPSWPSPYLVALLRDISFQSGRSLSRLIGLRCWINVVIQLKFNFTW